MSERPFMQLYVSDFVGDTPSFSTARTGGETRGASAREAGGMIIPPA
jgi:hypothetical protein